MQNIGQIIKKLRKERNLTQEELAEQLNVSGQAVSKWENGTSMPDITQVVPIASVFGVNVEVLFGTFGTNDNDEVHKIIDEAYQLNDDRTTANKVVYDALQKGLARYPTNMRLLMTSLEYGNALAWRDSENSSYDAENGQAIYKECIRQAELVTAYSKNITEVLRAHYIMVTLHSSHGNTEKAREIAQNFPWRSDMTQQCMLGLIAHSEKKYNTEMINRQDDLVYNLSAFLDNIALIGDVYRLTGKYDDAVTMFQAIFKIINIIYDVEEVMPPEHCVRSLTYGGGDVHATLARTYFEKGDSEKAFDWLTKMADYDLVERKKYHGDMRVKTPFLREARCYNVYNLYYDEDEIKRKLLKKLNSVESEGLKNDERFITLLNHANE